VQKQLVNTSIDGIVIAMKSEDLKQALVNLRLSQADFARLVGLTPRAVSLWMAEGKEVPGPVSAYAELLVRLPHDLLQIEMSKLKSERLVMKEGMYHIAFALHGYGEGVLNFSDGIVYGADRGGAKYDGNYVLNEKTSLIDMKIKVTFPPNGESVLDIRNPYEWSIDVTTSLNPKLDEGELIVKVSTGQSLKARYAFMRGLPMAA
jgi:transcriptional regulator with XRE-family HTH domain